MKTCDLSLGVALVVVSCGWQLAKAAIVVPRATYSLSGRGTMDVPFSDAADYSYSNGAINVQAVTSGLTAARPSVDIQYDVSGWEPGAIIGFPSLFAGSVFYYFSVEGPADSWAPVIFRSAGSAEAFGNSSAESIVEMRDAISGASYAGGGIAQAGGFNQPDYADFENVSRFRVRANTIIQVSLISRIYMGLNGSAQAVADFAHNPDLHRGSAFPMLEIDYDEPDADLFSLTLSENIIPAPTSLAAFGALSAAAFFRTRRRDPRQHV